MINKYFTTICQACEGYGNDKYIKDMPCPVCLGKGKYPLNPTMRQYYDPKKVNNETF